MASTFNDNVQNNSPKALDNKSGKFQSGAWRPYNDVAEALTSVISAYRHKGLTVNILKGGINTEYWWRDGVADGDLIEKTTASSGSNFSGSYNDLTNKPTIPSALADLTADATHRTVTDTEKSTWNAKATAGDIATAKSEILGGVTSDGDNLAKLLAKIQTITSIIGGTTADGDSVVNTVSEILAIFNTYPEGTDIATVLAGKVNTSAIVNALTETVTGKVLDATQGKALKDLIDTLAGTVAGNTSAIGNKADKVLSVKTISTLPYTLVDADNNYLILVSSSISGNIVLDATIENGFNCIVKQKGAGQITFIAGIGAPTIEAAGNRYKTSQQYAPATVVKESSTVWALGGDLTA